MKKIVIFDLDGTLLNTIGDLAYSCNVTLERHNLATYSLAEYKTFVGNGMLRLVERVIPEDLRTEELVATLRGEFVEYYHENISDYTEIYPGIEELLHKLQNEGYSLAVASNKFQEGTRKLISHFFPTINFEVVLGQRKGVALKPDPQIVLDIMEQTGFGAEDILYVGDSGIDMNTAKAAGVESVGVTWGFRPRAELEECEPDHIVDRAEDIFEFVK